MITDLWDYLCTVKKPIVLYGTGNGADKIVAKLDDIGVKIAGVFSSDGFKKNKVYAGHTVCDYNTLKAYFGDMIILLCFGSDRVEVIENIKSLSADNELYVPDVPVYGKDIFDTAFARKHAESLRAVYDMLADDISKKVFENTVYFKLTGRAEYLFEVDCGRDEVFDILNLKNNESFLDLGAFNGDTVSEFISYTGSYSDITAVEPDSRNFRKLTENTADIKNITLINAAVSDNVGTMQISTQHGRGIGKTAKTVSVPTVTVDEIAKKMPPTFIKMDVEGYELAAIQGGKNTISTLAPKMHIACYHNSYDIFEIPLKIKKMVPQYKIYMRRHHCLPAWDTNYIFIK